MDLPQAPAFVAAKMALLSDGPAAAATRGDELTAGISDVHDRLNGRVQREGDDLVELRIQQARRYIQRYIVSLQLRYQSIFCKPTPRVIVIVTGAGPFNLTIGLLTHPCLKMIISLRPDPGMLPRSRLVGECHSINENGASLSHCSARRRGRPLQICVDLGMLAGWSQSE
jgi:hypothetical protein